MKIVHVAPPWITIPPQNYGGTETVISHLIEEQVKQGHDVTLIAPGDACTSARLVSFYPQSLTAIGVPWEAHMKAFYHMSRALEYVQSHSFDILHAHLSSCTDMYLYPLLSMMGITTPVLTTLHSRFPFDRSQTWTGDADKFYMEWLRDMPVVAISEHARKEVPYPLNFVEIIHHGMPMEVLPVQEEGQERYLVWLGRIIEDKGTHHAIEVAQATGIPLVLAGTVDQRLEAAVCYFEEKIKPHIDGKLIRYAGPVNLAQKCELLRNALGFLNPIMWEEPFGLVMLEAIANGCPVISFARGAAPEIIASGKNGFLVNTVDEMVSCVSKLQQFDRKKVRAHAERFFSVQTMTEKYTQVYKRVISSARKEIVIRPRIAATPLQVADLLAKTNGTAPASPGAPMLKGGAMQ